MAFLTFGSYMATAVFQKRVGAVLGKKKNTCTASNGKSSPTETLIITRRN